MGATPTHQVSKFGKADVGRSDHLVTSGTFHRLKDNAVGYSDYASQSGWPLVFLTWFLNRVDVPPLPSEQCRDPSHEMTRQLPMILSASEGAAADAITASVRAQASDERKADGAGGITGALPSTPSCLVGYIYVHSK